MEEAALSFLGRHSRRLDKKNICCDIRIPVAKRADEGFWGGSKNKEQRERQ
jgi:hypothetical protein